MDYAAQFQARKDATVNLVPQEQIDRLQVLFKKGRNMFTSLFSEVEAIRRQVNNEALFADWCIYQLKISVNGLSGLATALMEEDDAARIRNEFAEAKRAEREKRAVEAHARRMEAQDRKNALSAKRVANAEHRAAEAEKVKKEKKTQRAAENKRRREEKDRLEGDAVTRAKTAILANPNATREAICKIADTHAIFYNQAIGELEGSGWVNPRAPKETASSEGALYEQYVEEGKVAAESKWTLGGLAIKVNSLKRYGDKTLERYATDIGVEYTTLRGYRRIAEAWPENAPRGSFSVCRELAPHPDRHVILAREPHMTVEEAREIMRKYRATTNVVPLREAE